MRRSLLSHIIFRFLAEFSCRASKPQTKKQRVAKKKKGDDSQDPYDFDSDEETQESGGKKRGE